MHCLRTALRARRIYLQLGILRRVWLSMDLQCCGLTLPGSARPKVSLPTPTSAITFRICCERLTICGRTLRRHRSWLVILSGEQLCWPLRVTSQKSRVWQPLVRHRMLVTCYISSAAHSMKSAKAGRRKSVWQGDRSRLPRNLSMMLKAAGFQDQPLRPLK